MNLQQYFDISEAGDRATFQRRLVEFAHDMDFGLVSSVLVIERWGRPTAFHYVGNRPAAFAAQSADRDLAMRDPVLARLRAYFLPFAYDQAFYVAAGVPELWDLAAPFGYRTGVSVALHLPGNRHLLLGIDREEALPSDQRLTSMMASLQLLAVHCQHVAQRLLVPDVPEQVPALSEREREVLKWAADGKTAWETSVILGISERTAVQHLQNATRRLGCVNKRQAAAKALLLGVIR